MKNLANILFFVLYTLSVYGQKNSKINISNKDTFTIQNNTNYESNEPYIKQGHSKEKVKDKNYGIRFEFGFSQLIYTEKTASWLGYHQSTNLNLVFNYNKLNIGFRFKPWTLNPKKELSFNNSILPKDADLNPFRLDLFIGYEKKLGKYTVIEPSLGITACTFKVINEDEIGGNYQFYSPSGLLIGVSIYKIATYINQREFLQLFGRINQGLVNYSRVHPSLGFGYTEVCIGFTLKSTWKRKSNLK